MQTSNQPLGLDESSFPQNTMHKRNVATTSELSLPKKSSRQLSRKFIAICLKKCLHGHTSIIFLPLTLAACGGEDINDLNRGSNFGPNSEDGNSDNYGYMFFTKDSFDYSDYVSQFVDGEQSLNKFGSFEMIFNDFNNDGDVDVMLQAWRGQSEFGSAMEALPEEHIVILDLVGQSGITIIGDQILTEARLGGLSRRHAVGNLNNDGIQDYAFAMNKEDGRSGVDIEMMLLSPTVLLSDSNSYYSKQSLGLADWGHSVETFPNSLGFDDVIFGGYNSGTEQYRGIQAYRYFDGEWIDVTALYPADPDLKWANSIRHLRLTEKNEFQDVLAVTATRDTTENGFYQVVQEGIKFYGLRDNSDWVVLGEFWIDLEESIQLVSWSGDPHTAQIGEYKGEEIIYPNFHEIVAVKDLNGSDYFIAKLSYMTLANDQLIDLTKIYQESGAEFSIHTELLFFKADTQGNFELVTSPIEDEIISIGYNFFSVEDVNADGLKDIVVSAYTGGLVDDIYDLQGHPVIYLGNEEGTFRQVSTKHLPGHSDHDTEYSNALYGSMKDINQDGYFDLIMAGGSTSTIEIIFLNEHL